MPTPSTIPPSNAKPFSLAEYRAFNDAIEARYPEVRAQQAVKRTEASRREVLHHLRCARRSQLADVRIAALEGAIELLLGGAK